MADIVVLGAGLSGTLMAYELAPRIGPEDTLTLIGEGGTYSFVPSNPWVAVGWRGRDEVEVGLERVTAKRRIRFLPQGAKRLHAGENRIEMNGGTSVSYDYLIIATGPELAFDEIPGLGPDGYTQSVCRIDHALAARVAFDELAKSPGPVVVGAAQGASCGDWRAGLRADFADPARIAFQGVYPASCGEREWSIAPADPGGYAARAVEGMWRELGGKLTGRVRDGKVPAGLAPAFGSTSPPLSEVVRDINKYSNNVMTQQVFLTLGLQKAGAGSFDQARSVLAQWWRQRLGAAEMPVVDNGAGLSREARVNARALARMLQHAWASPVMPEFMASLPIAGVDGTLRRRQGQAAGFAHLKTGALRDVVALAGYVHAASGRRYVLVGFVNHPNASAARPALDALVDWAASDR